MGDTRTFKNEFAVSELMENELGPLGKWNYSETIFILNTVHGELNLIKLGQNFLQNTYWWKVIFIFWGQKSWKNFWFWPLIHKLRATNHMRPKLGLMVAFGTIYKHILSWANTVKRKILAQFENTSWLFHYTPATPLCIRQMLILVRSLPKIRKDVFVLTFTMVALINRVVIKEKNVRYINLQPSHTVFNIKIVSE